MNKSDPNGHIFSSRHGGSIFGKDDSDDDDEDESADGTPTSSPDLSKPDLPEENDDLLVLIGRGGAKFLSGFNQRNIIAELKPGQRPTPGVVGKLPSDVSKAPNQRVPTAKNSEIWTPGRPGNPLRNLLEHFHKHGADFKAQNVHQYKNLANSFFRKPPPGTLQKVNKSGNIVQYNPNTNTFAVFEKSGVPRTLYKPDINKHSAGSNLQYFFNQ